MQSRTNNTQVLTFLRNLLVVPDAHDARGGAAQAGQLQEQLLTRFLDEGIMELLLNLAGYAHQVCGTTVPLRVMHAM